MTKRNPAVLFWIMTTLCLTSGCTHFVETRTIELFAHALKEQDLPTLKESASSNFDQLALRDAHALDDLQILRIPDGKISVVSVEDADKNHKHVTVEVGERKRRLLYELVRNEETGKWVVDDIFMKQRSEGLTAAKSITEQMDLLLTVREFLHHWEKGSRAETLAVTEEPLRKVLAALPPNYLAQVTQKIVQPERKATRYRPDAQLDDKVAVVRLPRRDGTIIVSMVLADDNKWKVRDVAFDAGNPANSIPSVKSYSMAIASAVGFLDAFAMSDKSSLRQVCTQKFYEKSLAPADLSKVTLATSDAASLDYEVEMRGALADFIVQTSESVLKVNLRRKDEDESVTSISPYMVDEVTIYELDGSQQKRLSAVFTAQAVTQIFSEALFDRDLTTVRLASTPDFIRRVWGRIDQAMFHLLPMNEFDQRNPKILSTVFQGAVTEVTAVNDQHAITFILRDWNGEILIDDLLLAVPNRPNSFKDSMEIIVSLYSFAAGFDVANIDQLQRTSSDDFNRLIWRQVRTLPDFGYDVPGHVLAPVTSISVNGETATIAAGDTQWGARAELIREANRYVLDEVVLFSGPLPHQQIRLKNDLRQKLAAGLLYPQPTKSTGSAAITPQGEVVPRMGMQPAGAADAFWADLPAK